MDHIRVASFLLIQSFFRNGDAVLQISTGQLQIKSNQYDGYILIRSVTY